MSHPLTSCSAVMMIFQGARHKPNQVQSSTQILKQHLQPLVLAFENRYDLEIPKLTYIENVCKYESVTMAANLETNVQEHFVQKLTKFITTMFVKRRLPGVDIRVARSAARRVKRAVLERHWSPLMTIAERVFAIRLIFIINLPANVVSVHYDVKASPMKVCVFSSNSSVSSFLQAPLLTL
jgi:hypothetical protein